MNDQQPKIPPLRPAATVILVREHRGQLQTYLLKRSAQSGFMGGKYVFPGGTLDAGDRQTDFWKAHVDLAAAEMINRLGGGLEQEAIYAYGVAAIRETLEESGVLLAQSSGGKAADYRSAAVLRMAPDLPQNWFLELIEREGWQLRFSRLARWAQWITPARMKQRYDTRFFLAFMPEGQTCAPDTRETVAGLWVSPEAGLSGNLSGEIPLSPPTVITLHQLLAYPTLDDLKQEIIARPWGEAQAPNMVITPAGPIILEPWDPEWHQKTIQVDPDDLIANILPVGEPISRIWLHDGLWLPVKA